MSDMPYSRAGRFGTKGLAITFVTSAADEEVLKEIQSRFEVAIPTLPDNIDRTFSLHAFYFLAYCAISQRAPTVG